MAFFCLFYCKFSYINDLEPSKVLFLMVGSTICFLYCLDIWIYLLLAHLFFHSWQKCCRHYPYTCQVFKKIWWEPIVFTWFLLHGTLIFRSIKVVPFLVKSCNFCNPDFCLPLSLVIPRMALWIAKSQNIFVLFPKDFWR